MALDNAETRSAVSPGQVEPADRQPRKPKTWLVAFCAATISSVITIGLCLCLWFFVGRNQEVAAWSAIGKARYYQDNREYNKAIESFDEAIRLHPTLAHTYRRKGWCHFDQQDYRKASEAFSQASKMDPDNKDIQIDKAFALIQMDEYGKALEPLNHVLQSEPNNLKALELRADVHFRLGNADESAADRSTLRRLILGDQGGNTVSTQ